LKNTISDDILFKPSFTYTLTINTTLINGVESSYIVTISTLFELAGACRPNCSKTLTNFSKKQHQSSV